MEGVTLPASTTQVLNKGKEPVHDEGPSGAQETDVILIQDDEAEAENAKLRMTIQEQDTEIKDLILNFERARWVTKYLT